MMRRSWRIDDDSGASAEGAAEDSVAESHALLAELRARMAAGYYLRPEIAREVARLMLQSGFR